MNQSGRQYDDAALRSKGSLLSAGRRRLLLSVVIALSGIACSCSFYWLLRTQEREVAKGQFLRSADGRAKAVQDAITERLNTVNTLMAYFAGSEVVERKEFRTFVEPLLKEHDGILALGWAPRIQGSQRRPHEQLVRHEGFPKYEITERDAGGKFVTAATRAEYCPVLFIEPSEKNRPLLGFDIESMPACRDATQRAMSTKRPAAGICSPMGVDAADGALLYVVAPAENESPNPANRSANPSAGDGFVFGLFHIEAIVESALEPMSASGIDVSVVAPSGTNGDTVIYPRDRKTVEPAAKSASDLPFVAEIDVADRRWKFNCVAMNGFWARRRTWEPTTVLLAGLLVTGFLVGYIHLLSGHTARVEKVVAERTRELHESEQRFRRLVDNAGDSFGLHTEQGKILDVNKHMCESLGYTREELLSMTLADIDADYVPKNLEQYAKLRPEEYPVSFEGVHRRKDGTTFPVEVRLTSLIVNGQRLMLGLARDITERKRAEEALDDERRLLRTMLDMHERDRKLVAYEIHDGLAQQLTGALFKFQSIEPLRERDPDAAREMLDEAIRLLRDAMTETRRLIGGLRPPILDESGVVDAIDYLLSERRQRGGPKIEFVHLSELGRLAPPLESAIFRIVQEGLTNACRYSQSEKVRVSLEQVNNRVHVEVRDWGIGFDPARVERGHFGIQGIRERAQLLGGNVVIDAAPGKGTRIIVDLPLLPAIENGTAKTAEQD